MTYMTHRQFAVFWALAGAMVLYCKSMTEVNYYMALIIILAMAKVGAEFPDYDHIWQNVKNKTVPSWIINKLIHITGGKHRSWQTHSIDIAAVATFLSYYLPEKLYELEVMSNVDSEVLSIIMIGFSIGWLSHLFSDMLTPSGVRLLFFWDFKIKLVPKRIFSLRFSTGSEWESFIYTVTKVLNILVGIVAVVFPFIYKDGGLDIIGRIKEII